MIDLKYTLTFFLLTISFQGYSQEQHHHGPANTKMNQSSFETLITNFEDESRNDWQKPEEVMAIIGDMKGKTVMDVGSGTGYFSFRLANAGAKVICADVDDRFLAYIENRMKHENISGDQMALRKVPYHSSTLQPAEVDVVLIVDTYHHIQERVDYFAEVRRGLKPGGKLVVIDFEKRELPVGPPVSLKLSEDEVVAELVRVGFSNFSINRDLLPYQYIIEAY